MIKARIDYSKIIIRLSSQKNPPHILAPVALYIQNLSGTMSRLLSNLL